MSHVASYCLVSLASVGGSREVTKSDTGRLCPSKGPTPYPVINLFDREGTPFLYVVVRFYPWFNFYFSFVSNSSSYITIPPKRENII